MGKIIDETGNTYGRLTVLKRAEEGSFLNKEKRAFWLCKCTCGNTVVVSGKNLREGLTKSCGCLQKERAKRSISLYNIKNNTSDLTNKRFGRLIALYPTNERANHSVIWYCKCDCGNFCKVSADCLSNGKTKSCGCLRKEKGAQKLAKWSSNTNNKISIGEGKIISILNKEHINFIKEKQFSDDGKIKNYRYDFYLPILNIILEYNGEQHYCFNNLFYKSREDFKKAQERDRRKISYCLAHDIKMYAIPFWEIDSINSFNDIISEKFFVKSKFHNDEVWREHQKNR